MNTMSWSSRTLRIRSTDSSAARLPVSGSAPAPSPFVIPTPSWIFVGESDVLSDWASVFAAMNSTPVRLLEIMVLTALQPPPPIPITLMRADLSPFSSHNSNIDFTSI